MKTDLSTVGPLSPSQVEAHKREQKYALEERIEERLQEAASRRYVGVKQTEVWTGISIRLVKYLCHPRQKHSALSLLRLTPCPIPHP